MLSPTKSNGPIAQLARARAWHARGQGFKPLQVHHIELAASLGASPLASAGSFARKLKGFLKSIESFYWLIWRFRPIFFFRQRRKVKI